MTDSTVPPLPKLEEATRAKRQPDQATEPTQTGDEAQPPGAPAGSPEVTMSENGSGAPPPAPSAGPGGNKPSQAPIVPEGHPPARRAEGLWERVPGGFFILLATAAVLIALFAVAELPIPFLNERFTLSHTEKGWLALAVLLVVVAVILLQAGTKRLARVGSPTRGSFGTSLLSSALLDLGVAATVVIVIVVLNNTGDPWNIVAIAAGLVTAVLTAAIFANFQRERTWASRVNPWQYGQVAAKWAGLDAECAQLCPADGNRSPDIEVPCNKAITHLAYVAEALGLERDPMPDGLKLSGQAQPDRTSEPPNRQPARSDDRWVLGIGFVEMWERIHAAEAVLYPLRTTDQIVANGVTDELRVLGSGMANEGELLNRLRRAVVVLGGRAYLFEDPFLDETIDDGPEAQAEAKQVLAGVRRSIDQFRDNSRSGLARTRIHLIWTGLVTAVIAAALLALAILMGADRHQIVAGVTFFLVASAVGLLWQLRSLTSESRSGEDDFGLDNARMLYTPVLSGLAGVGGVLIMGMLYPTLNVALDPTQLADVSATAEVTVPTLQQIFSLDANRFGIIVAAVFGLTPDLLINRLQGQADRYKVDLQNTSVPARNPAPAPFALGSAATGTTVITRAAGAARTLATRRALRDVEGIFVARAEAENGNRR